MQTSLLVVLLIVPVAAVHALDVEGIEAAIRLGATAKEFDDLTGFHKVGGKIATDEEPIDGRLDSTGTGYYFYVGSCKEWIEIEAFLAKQEGGEVDRAEIRERCEGREELQVAVVGKDYMGAAGSILTLSLPIPGRPIGELFLEVDGTRLDREPRDDFHGLGRGSAYGIFDASKVRNASTVRIVAVLDSGKRIAIKLKNKLKSKLF
jgi:hypothetical protein